LDYNQRPEYQSDDLTTRPLGLHKMGSSVISSTVEPLPELKSFESYIYIMLLNVLRYVIDWSYLFTFPESARK